MAFSMAGGGPSGPQINVTPLIDVLLTLIIMFMLVVAMDPEYGEKVQIPQPPTDPKSQPSIERTVVLQIIWTAKDKPPTVRINQEDVRWEDLELRLAQISAKLDSLIDLHVSLAQKIRSLDFAAHSSRSVLALGCHSH